MKVFRKFLVRVVSLFGIPRPDLPLSALSAMAVKPALDVRFCQDLTCNIYLGSGMKVPDPAIQRISVLSGNLPPNLIGGPE